jgi:ABC-2 type transport system ATP-binding protein
MSQGFSLYPDLTAVENLAFHADIHGGCGGARRARQAELIELLRLGPYLDRRADQLSGGWKQRLAMACALLHRPQVIFLDEPTAGVDPVARRELWDLLLRLTAEGITLFITTHSMDEAERCSLVGYLRMGRLLAAGSPAELKRLPCVTPPGTRRLEILGPDLAGLLRRLSGQPGVQETTIHGNTLCALVDASRSLAEFGLSPTSARPADPSLEDVFVALARAQGRSESKTKIEALE